MNKEEALEILIVHASCSFCERSNILCYECPWHKKEQCKMTKITPELILEAINAVTGSTVIKMKLSDIKITSAFANTMPSKEKMYDCRLDWNTYHKQDRYIVVNKNGYLVDGYIQYLVLKENDVEEAEVKVIDNKRKMKNAIPNYRNKPTTYIYGYHPNAEIKKEYVWRIPNSEKWDWYRNSVRVGDKVMCRTKFGNHEVIVTKIEVLDKHPVDGIIKNVASADIMRGGYNVVT